MATIYSLPYVINVACVEGEERCIDDLLYRCVGGVFVNTGAPCEEIPGEEPEIPWDLVLIGAVGVGAVMVVVALVAR